MNKFISKLRGILEPPEIPTPRKAADIETAVEPDVAPTPNTNSDKQETTQTSSIEQLWDKYKEWLSEHFEQSLDYLNPGVSEEHLVILERSISHELPADYRDWLKIHNGQSPESAGLLYSNEFLSVSRVLEEWLGMKGVLDQGKFSTPIGSTPDSAIIPVWWSTSWLPISANGSGKLICIDLEPGDNGVAGQVIDIDHESDQGHVLTDSFKDYIVSYLDDLTAKKYRYAKDLDRLSPLN